MTKPKDEKFGFCGCCEELVYTTRCECHSSTCNAGGCEKCKDELQAAHKAIAEGNTPFHHRKKCKKALVEAIRAYEEGWENLKRICQKDRVDD
jgi:hypothetical protein